MVAGDVTVGVEFEKVDIGGEGCVSLARHDAPGWDLEPVRKALSAKLPKLVTADADIRVLLLEKFYPFPSTDTVANDVAVLRAEFPQLSQISEVWLVNTVAWHDEGRKVYYVPIWPEPEETRIPRQFGCRIAVPRPEDLGGS